MRHVQTSAKITHLMLIILEVLRRDCDSIEMRITGGCRPNLSCFTIIIIISTLFITFSWRLIIIPENQIKSPENKIRIAIGILVDWENKWKVHKLSKMLRSIDFFNTTDILLFSDEKPDPNFNKNLTDQNLTHHKIHHVPIKFNFPPGFNSNAKSPYRTRTKWGYMHMCRFWFKNIWQHAIVQRYKYLMRFDTDSCMVNKTFQLSLDDKYKYLHGKYRFEYKFINDLNKTIFQYISKHNIIPKNPDLLKNYKETKGELPIWYNNVEITDTSFMLSPEVQQFIETIDHTHGQYKYRWGDAPLRYATMALFTSPGEVVSLGMGNSYRHPC